MAGFSASTAILSGFRLIGRHPGMVLAWGLAYVAVALAPLLILFWGDLPTLLGLYSKIMQSLMAGAAPPVNDPDLARQQGLLVAFEVSQIGLNLLAVTLVSCAIYRAVLEPERKAFGYLRVGMQELWVLASMLALGVVLVAVLITSSVAVGLVGQAVGAGTWLGGLILFLASCGAVALVIWVALRLSMAAPMSFAQRRSSLIGFLMLLGLAAKNSILLVEYAIEREREGVGQREALIEACRERARPIVMTTMAMAAGMLPTAFALEKGAEFRQPMAVAVIGGLMTSTILSLVLVPVVYEFVDDFENWLKPRLAKLVTPRHADDRPTPDDRL